MKLFGHLRTLVEYAFAPVRTGELIVCFVFTWWVVSVAIRGNTFESPGFRYVSSSWWGMGILFGALLLMWANFFHLVKKYRQTVLFIPLLVGVFTTGLLVFAVKTHPSPSIGLYLGMVWLAISNCFYDGGTQWATGKDS